MAKICNIDGCDYTATRHGYCKDHFTRLVQHGRKDLLPAHVFVPCTVDGCDRYVLAKGLCERHYQRMRRTGKTERTQYINDGECSVDGCDRDADNLGFCIKHYYRYHRYGDATYRKHREHNMYGTKTYRTWHNAVHTLPNQSGFPAYEPWLDSFATFFDDMGEIKDGEWLCRRDRDKGYTPDNCFYGPPTEAMKVRRYSKGKGK